MAPTIPRSTIETIGSSGSFTSWSAARTIASSSGGEVRGLRRGFASDRVATRAGDRCCASSGYREVRAALAHHVAPGSLRRTAVNPTVKRSKRLAVVETSAGRVAHRWWSGQAKVGEDRLDAITPATLQLGHRRIDDPGIEECRLPGERREHGRRVRAELLQCGDQARSPLGRVARETFEPRSGVHQVVALLADQLPDEVGEWRPRGTGKRVEPDGVGGVVQVSPGDRHRPVAATVVEEPAVSIVVRLTVIGEGVRIGRRQAHQAIRTAPRRGQARPARSSSSPRPPRGAARSRSTRNRRIR